MSNTIIEPTYTIDIAPLFCGRHSSVESALAQALADHGSFVATGFAGVAGFDERISDLLSFFAMAEAEKLVCATGKHVPHNPNFYRGFYPLPTKPHCSYNETFDIGPQPAITSPDVPGANSFRENNVWPLVEPVPDWRDKMLAMLDFQRELAVVLMAAIARGLGLDEETLVAPALGRNATLRLLHYAAVPPDFGLRREDEGQGCAELASTELPVGDESESDYIGDGRRLIAGCHVDTGLVSLVWQDATGGLQMKGPDGVWRDVPQVSAGLSVHCGDLIKPLTDGRLEGTPHRVVGRGEDRCSVGFFLEPDFETEVVVPDGDSPVCYARHLVNQFPDRFERPGTS